MKSLYAVSAPLSRSLVLALCAITACTTTTETGSAAKLEEGQKLWSVSFGQPLSSTVAAFEATVVRGPCTSTTVVSSQEFPADTTGITPAGLNDGTYGLIINARDEDCRVVASGCTTFDVPSLDRSVEVRLQPTRSKFACESSQCTDGRCDFSVDAGRPEPPRDSGPSGSDQPLIYRIKSGEVTLGTVVTLTGVTTGVTKTGTKRDFFLQVPESEHDEALGYQYSGIYVHMGNSPLNSVPIPKVGQRVTVTGKVSDFHGQTQLAEVEKITLGAEGQPVPAPQVVIPSDVKTGGPLAGAYEAVLVKVERAVVDEGAPPATQFDDAKNEFSVGGGLRVNDLFYALSPLPAAGSVMTIAGILRYSHDNSKVEPRGPEDIEYHLALRGFAQRRVCLPTTATNASSNPPLRVELTGPAPAGGAVISLASSSADVTVPASVTIDQGQASAEVLLTVNNVPSGTVTITATYEADVVTAEVTVQDGSQVRLASLTPALSFAAPGEKVTLTAALNCPSPDPLSYSVASSSSAASAGATLSFDPGEGEATLEVTAGSEGTAEITLTKDAESLSALVAVQNVLLSEVFYNPSGLDDGLEWVELYNPGDTAVDLSGYSLGHSNAEYLTDYTEPLSGTIPPGGCFVVGGPNGPAGGPDLAQDFNPDIQNAGDDKTDAVALYAQPEASLLTTSVPIDVVVYGPTGGAKNNIKGPLGDVLEPDVDEAGSSRSIERTPQGWRVQASPTPGDCTALSGS